jgi:Ni,Fe-hydrogenase I cytochrome b subunit
MPLDVRANAIRIAVLAFFLLCIIGICCGLAPYTICSRAIIGAFAVYIAAAVTVKIINVVLLDVLITKFLDNQKRQKNEPEY